MYDNIVETRHTILRTYFHFFRVIKVKVKLFLRKFRTYGKKNFLSIEEVVKKSIYNKSNYSTLI